MNDTNAGKKFQDFAYPNIQLPGKIGEQFLDFVRKVDKTLKEYKQNVAEAFAEKKKDSAADVDNKDGNTDENGSPAADNKDEESSHQKNGNDVEGTSSIRKPENDNVETTKEEKSDKD